MERIIEDTQVLKAGSENHETSKDKAVGLGPAPVRIDMRSLFLALASGIGFFLLATASLSLSKFDTTLASIWLPNAIAVAFLLRARISSELPFFASVFLASVLANSGFGTSFGLAVIFSIANVLDIAVVTWITRRGCGQKPDMTDLAHLARFIWAGGGVGPLLSACIAAMAMGPNETDIWAGAIAWLLTDSMSMVLLVPTLLLAHDAIIQRVRLTIAELGERIVLLSGGIACAFLVFQHEQYSLLFLIPPITLLHAFRLGSLGTALYVTGLAAVSSAMTWGDLGPIHQAASGPVAELHLLQAFVAANFLTGLPMAAILAGRARLVTELETGKAQLDLLASNITDAILRYDANGICTYASPSVTEVLGRPPETFLGLRASDRMHEDASDGITAVERRLLSGESEKERLTYRRLLDRQDGTPVFIEADCATAIDPVTGDPEGFVVSARDVTERVELELLLTRARKHAERAAKAKSEFLANMSHEIRTPMNGVLGFAELMLQSDLPEQERKHTEMIVQSGRSMMLLLNDILDLSKIEAGQFSIDLAPVDLEQLLRECAALHRPASTKKGLELTLERSEPISSTRRAPWIMTDDLRVRQIVLNLVGNAVKFTESGGIKLSYALHDETVEIAVSDTGIGISQKRLSTIFEPFTQGESNTARRFGGTGLGLTISRQIAELLGGQISVESEAGVGSRFTLTVPAKAAPPKREAVARRTVSPDDLPLEARILLAEDHDVNRMLATEMLERCGQTVAVAHDGNEAISMVIDSMIRGTPFDLILMDLQMPGCDGYAAVRAIRAEGIGPDTLPIIALTANAFPEDITAARDAGMQGHLAKPMVFAELARTLQRWLPTQIIEDERSSANNAARSRQLIARWQNRKAEAVNTVCEALENGWFEAGDRFEQDRARLARIIHKLAGSAAMFGEAELGEKAAEMEQALRRGSDGNTLISIGIELLDWAESRADYAQDLRA